MYVKIHEQLFNSSIMEEDVETRYVWLTLLTLADKDGFVDMTTQAIARRINIDEEIVKRAISIFSNPDPSSRTPDNEGRRLEKIRDSFGWQIINYRKYSSLRNEESRREQNREAQKRHRNKSVIADCQQCQPRQPKSAHTDTDTDTDTDTKIYTRFFDEIWSKYPKRDGKKAAFRHFKVSVKTQKDLDDIRIALDNYLSSETVTNGFVKNGSTWFNNWRDWIDYIEPAKKTQADKDQELIEKLKKEGY